MDDNSEPGSASGADPEQDPELSVKRLMSELVDQASAILAAQHRLRRLLRANRSIVQGCLYRQFCGALSTLRKMSPVPSTRRWELSVQMAYWSSSCTWAWTRTQSGQSVSCPRVGEFSAH